MERLIEAADLATTEQTLRGLYGSLRLESPGGRAGLRLASTDVGPIRLDRAEFALGFRADVDPLGAYVFGQITAGRAHYRSGGQERDHGPGDVCLVALPDQPYAAVIEDTALDLAVVDPVQVDRLVGGGPGPVRFTGYEPVSEAAAASWRATYAFVRDQVLTGAPLEPLVAANAAQLLIATALATFPNTARFEPTAADRQEANSRTVRRAVEFIEAHADAALTVGDLARAAFVTTRALQLAFRRHLDTTPMAYLRGVRLDRAHAELLAAAPGDGVTVTAVAARWGYARSSRFAADYRARYARTPGQTLRSGPR